MGGHASCVQHECKKCGSRVRTTGATVQSSREEKAQDTCSSQPSPLEGARLESWGRYLPAWANLSRIIKDLVFLISMMSIFPELEIM